MIDSKTNRNKYANWWWKMSAIRRSVLLQNLIKHDICAIWGHSCVILRVQGATQKKIREHYVLIVIYNQCLLKYIN